jgi:phage terminase large subunit
VSNPEAEVAQLQIPEKLVRVFEGEADTRGAYGGRGSAKSRTFAKMTAVRAHMWAQAGESGLILCGRQFMNSLADSSLEEIKAAIRETEWLTPHFDIGEKYIATACGRISYAFAGLDRNIDSVKSKSRIRLCWVDEAEPVTEDAWTKLDPTLREDDSELWVTWNPESKRSATHKRFRQAAPDNRTRIVEMNWRDNPWFPAILERKRLKDLRDRPDQYDHIWEGGFKTVHEGAYYAASLTKAKAEGRISFVAPDPLMTIRAVWDIGGTGAKADACSIWICQFVGREIRVLDHYTAQGQPLSAHVAWLRENGYGKTLCILPHDGETNDRVFDVSYESELKRAGFEVIVVPNQGKGAASMRIEAGRRLFPRIWFNEKTTEAGREALGAYHEKRDDERGVGLGPNHDWSSHDADSFGLMCVAYEEPMIKRQAKPPAHVGGGGWMG